MIGKWISSIMAGVFISMGAMVYLSIPNSIVGSLFFATGIFLVLNFHNMLFTRVCPLAVYDCRYNWSDTAATWFGNGIGTVLAALVVNFTRFGNTISDPVQKISEVKLGDNPLSLFILGVLCAFFVAFAVLAGMKYESGSLGQVFYVWLFITAFVFCGFEHIVADMFYLSCYILKHEAEISDVVKVLVCVTAGNIVGGVFIAWMIKKLDQK